LTAVASVATVYEIDDVIDPADIHAVLTRAPTAASPSHQQRKVPRMTTFALIHGGFHTDACWYLLEPELVKLGHRTATVRLPISEIAATPGDYLDTAVAAFGNLDEPPVVVGHSLGGWTALELTSRIPTTGVVLLCSALFLAPGTIADEPQPLVSIPPEDMAPDDAGLIEFTDEVVTRVFYQDCPPDITQRALKELVPQAVTGLVVDAIPTPATSCVYVRALDDAAVNPDWSEWAARRITGRPPLTIGGGHSPMLSRPAELAAMLHGILTDFPRPTRPSTAELA
jgi:pimeloyl-ACP methyl ester carboxylesterase